MPRRCYTCRSHGRDGSDCPICQEPDADRRLDLARARLLDAGQVLGRALTAAVADARTVDGSIVGPVRR